MGGRASDYEQKNEQPTIIKKSELNNNELGR